MSQYHQQINTVFFNSAPGAIFNQSIEDPKQHINESNPNITATAVYVPEKKYQLQKMGSIKITLLTRNMANSILHYGIKIYGCKMEPGSIRQGQYLSTAQCNYCSNQSAPTVQDHIIDINTNQKQAKMYQLQTRT